MALPPGATMAATGIEAITGSRVCKAGICDICAAAGNAALVGTGFPLGTCSPFGTFDLRLGRGLAWPPRR